MVVKGKYFPAGDYRTSDSACSHFRAALVYPRDLFKQLNKALKAFYRYSKCTMCLKIGTCENCFILRKTQLTLKEIGVPEICCIF